MKSKKYLLSVISLLMTAALMFSIPVFSSADAPTLAFPEADGAGKYTIGGRGGRVIEVTTLEDGKGIPGSLRAAVEASGPRTIVFKVAGTIELKEQLKLKNGFVTIAGQTAPGDGITLKNYTFSINCDQVIVRNIRVRLGAVEEADSMSINDCKNVIIDHCSVSWGVDETFSVKRADNVTIQWSFVTEGLHDSIHSGTEHSKGSLINGSNGQIVTLHHNLYAHHDARSPRPQNSLSPAEDSVGFYFNFTNNVIYDWGRTYAAKNLDEDSVCIMNFINNYFIAGPSSEASNFMLDMNKSSSMFFSGNYMNGKMPEDQYSLIIYENFVKPSDREWKLSEPFDSRISKVQTAEQAYAMVLENAGASLSRDAVDTRLVKEILTGTGRIIDDPSNVGGWPKLAAGEAYLDTDKDGISDAWEDANGLDKNNPADGALDADSDGYTNLEEFLNSLMAGLYEEDVEIPKFDNSKQKLYHFFYKALRFFLQIKHFFQDAFSTLFPSK